MNIIARLTFCLLFLSMSGCGPAFLLVDAMANKNMQDRCMALEKKADKDKLSSIQTRHLLINNNCQQYVEKYYSRN